MDMYYVEIRDKTTKAVSGRHIITGTEKDAKTYTLPKMIRSAGKLQAEIFKVQSNGSLKSVSEMSSSMWPDFALYRPSGYTKWTKLNSDGKVIY